MSLAVIAVLGGLICLIFGADKLVQGASSLAINFSVSPFIIGVLVIGFGTSTPEILVSVIAALENNTELLMGNAYGSSIANIGLVLGFSAMLFSVPISGKLLKIDLPILLLVLGVAGTQLFDFKISLFEASGLLICFLGFIVFSLKKKKTLAEKTKISEELPAVRRSVPISLFWTAVGFALLIFGAKILVWGAIEISLFVGLDELFVGLTVVAIGTSLPELATSIVAVRKKEHELFLGNIIGSNIFNTLAVVGIGGAIREIQFQKIFLTRDFSFTVFLSVLLFLFCIGKTKQISHFEGAIFVIIYLAYIAYLYLEATGSL